MGDLSPHFSRKEFECRCCGRLELHQNLIDGLEALRNRARVPVIIHAGYRCPQHNLEVGGVAGGEHTRGMAADIHMPGLALQQMYELALEIPQFADGGIGAHDGDFLHVDVREHQARWARVRGRYVGIHQWVREPQLRAEKTDGTHAG